MLKKLLLSLFFAPFVFFQYAFSEEIKPENPRYILPWEVESQESKEFCRYVEVIATFSSGGHKKGVDFVATQMTDRINSYFGNLYSGADFISFVYNRSLRFELGDSFITDIDLIKKGCEFDWWSSKKRQDSIDLIVEFLGTRQSKVSQ